jgi:transaldolase
MRYRLVMATNHLHEIEALGQSVWLDNISRGLIEDGDLARLVEDGVSGVTSNPTIFDKAMSDTDRYDAAFADAASAGVEDPREAFFRIGGADIQDACDILAPVYESTDGKDGYVSFELPPDVSDDVEGSVEVAKRLHADVDRPNLLIKVPGTEAGVKAFEELTAAGISVNVTLLFAVKRYEQVAEAYLSGLGRRAEAGSRSTGSPRWRASSSRGWIPRLTRRSRAWAAWTWRGRPASPMRSWHTSLSSGCSPARVGTTLWPRAPIRSGHSGLRRARRTSNIPTPCTSTMSSAPKRSTRCPTPLSRRHATTRRRRGRLNEDVEAAHALIGQLREIGVPFDRIVDDELTEEGLASFSTSFDSLVETVGQQLRQTATKGS